MILDNRFTMTLHYCRYSNLQNKACLLETLRSVDLERQLSGDFDLDTRGYLSSIAKSVSVSSSTSTGDDDDDDKGGKQQPKNTSTNTHMG